MATSALHLTVEYGDEKIVEGLLVIWNMDVNSKNFPLGKTPLHIAVEKDNLKVARMLLQWKANVNEPMDDNRTALHIAAAKRSSSMVKLLLDHGASVNPRKKLDGKTPLDIAVEYNCFDISKMLLNRGLYFQDATVSSSTLFDVAQKIGNNKLALLILEHARLRYTLTQIRREYKIGKHKQGVVETLKKVCDKQKGSLLDQVLKRQFYLKSVSGVAN